MWCKVSNVWMFADCQGRLHAFIVLILALSTWSHLTTLALLSQTYLHSSFLTSFVEEVGLFRPPSDIFRWWHHSPVEPNYERLSATDVCCAWRESEKWGGLLRGLALHLCFFSPNLPPTCVLVLQQSEIAPVLPIVNWVNVCLCVCVCVCVRVCGTPLNLC